MKFLQTLLAWLNLSVCKVSSFLLRHAVTKIMCVRGCNITMQIIYFLCHDIIMQSINASSCSFLGTYICTYI